MKILTKSLAVSALALAAAGAVSAQEVEFWTMPYGDQIAWNDTVASLLEGFTAESGIEVNHEIVPWGSAFQTYLNIAQGGAAPDCADMYWLHSFSAIGGENFGPMPINEYRDQFDLDAFYAGALTDVTWQGDFYGVPWRGDIRSILYRADHFEEAGIDAAPTTWEEMVEAAIALTERDENGNVTRWGFAFGSSGNVVDFLLPLYWQAGGEMMTEDGLTATIDNAAMRDALQFMHDMLHVHQVTDIDAFEPNYDMFSSFVNGQIAMIASGQQNWGSRLDADFPQLEGTWAFAPSAHGSEDADSFSGSGYLGVLRGSDYVEQCVALLEYLARPENMLVLSQASGAVGTMPEVMASEFWSDRPWKQVVGVALEDAHTSQHPSPAWSSIATSEPGGVIYDLIYNVVVLQEDMDAEIATAQSRMQEELDRAS
ncbi:extracellular solute-binding protein [Gymnodinialimonas sp. 2305UL16-5]|uniref:extracellular solute-binding protein n=1 Tax=Gymnodinialimonas mytili TaxID=3126503 RepID=UPI0030B04020